MLKDDILKFVSQLSSRILTESEDEPLESPKVDLVDEVKNAHRDWVLAQKQLDWVTDPDLVDQAIYAEVAARKRYTYLLKKAKEHFEATDLSKPL